MLVGAGTIVRPDQVDLALDAGAQFIVSPGFSSQVVERCQAVGLPVLPGVATATDVMAALDLGIDLLKLFPAEASGGLDLLRALQGPFPDVRFVPTGGVNSENAAEYLSLPSVAAIGGSWMVAPAARGRARRRGDHPSHGRGCQPREKARDMTGLTIRPAEDCAYDLVALGEIMLRLDPGEKRVRTARTFDVWEGGGEYNVARGLRRCFGLRTAVVTAFADNDVGRLLEDLVLQGGVDASFIRWTPCDGAGRTVRNGINFTERGFGVRGALGVSDRGNTAAAQLATGDIDWDHLFGVLGVRWFHTGGIFAALSATTPDVVEEAVAAAARHGTIVSYDLNYRPSLWESIGGVERAQEVNRRLARYVDVMLGNEEDFTACLGLRVGGADGSLSRARLGVVPFDDRARGH